MEMIKINANTRELFLDNGLVVLFSYDTPVATYDPMRGVHFISNKKWSPTTSRQINKWLVSSARRIQIEQSYFDDLIQSVDGDLYSKIGTRYEMGHKTKFEIKDFAA